MRDLFEFWELTKTPIPKRTLLLPLEPIGIGTPLVESLTSYISRLAGIHAVTVSDLAGHVLANCAPPDAPIVSVSARHYRMGSGFQSGAHSINGATEDAGRWIAAVETATGRSGLRFLTLTPLKQVFCRQSLFRKAQAWCPVCFEDCGRSGLPLYLPLSWALRMVGICAKHMRPFEDTCPHCGRHFGPLDACNKPGYCSRCRCWLGQSASLQQEFGQEQCRSDQVWTAACVGDVLASMPELEEDHLGDILRENIAALGNKVADGNHRAFSVLTGVRADNAWGWLAGRHLPRPSVLFQICHRLQIQTSELLRRNGNWNAPAEIAAAGFATSARGAWRDDPDKMKAALLDALKEDPPPSLNEVALRLNYRTCAPLKRLDLSTCKMIVRRYRAFRRRWYDTWIVRGREYTPHEIETILTESLARERPIPIAQIVAQLGHESAQRLRTHFPELCKAIAHKMAQDRRKSRERVRAALVNAIAGRAAAGSQISRETAGVQPGSAGLPFPGSMRATTGGQTSVERVRTRGGPPENRRARNGNEWCGRTRDLPDSRRYPSVPAHQLSGLIQENRLQLHDAAK